MISLKQGYIQLLKIIMRSWASFRNEAVVKVHTNVKLGYLLNPKSWKSSKVKKVKELS